ncbi:MAG: RNA polymerase factor sigma-32 [Proteobacteria bacterium]|nr:RNA polymerase factor sigma-32 [Pseudomonadota bacterium]
MPKSGAHSNTVDYDNRYIQRVMKQDLLGREEELRLARAFREGGDEKALHALVMAYTRLVVAIAARFRHYGLPMADLIQEGNVGIMQAANRFDLTREVRFSTYAVWWIRASVQDYVLRNWSIVRTGTTAAHKSLFFKLRHLRARINDQQGHGDVMTDEGRQQIADTIGVNISDVAHMEGRLSGVDTSLDAPVGEEGDMCRVDLLADTRPNPEEHTMEARDSQKLRGWLGEALKKLTPREREIIVRRRLSDTATTLEHLGLDLGVSKERVRQLETRALHKMRMVITAHAKDDGSVNLLPLTATG